MMPRAGTRMRRVKNLARVGMWIALTAEFALVISVSTGWWLWVATGGAAALAVLSIVADVAERIAAVAELEAGGRRGGWRGKGSGLSGRGREDDGQAGDPAGGDDVGPRGPAACAPWPATPGVRAAGCADLREVIRQPW